MGAFVVGLGENMYVRGTFNYCSRSSKLQIESWEKSTTFAAYITYRSAHLETKFDKSFRASVLLCSPTFIYLFIYLSI